MNCIPCSKSFSGKVPYEQHLASVKHKKKVESYNVLKNSKNESSPTLNDGNIGTNIKGIHCDACDISFCSLESFQSHSLTREHAEKIILGNLNSSLNNSVVDSSTNEEVKKIDGKGPDDKILLESGNYTKSNQLFFNTCDVCNKHFSGPEPYRQHLESAIHKKKVEQQNTPNQNILVYSCETCKKNFTGQIPYIQHLESDAHKKKIQNLQYLQKCTSEVDSLSEIHVSKVEENELKINNNNSFFCNICKVSCTGFDPYQQHIAGKAHMKKAIQSGSSPSENSMQNETKMETDCVLPELEQILKLMSTEELTKSIKIFKPDEEIDFDKSEDNMHVESATENVICENESGNKVEQENKMETNPECYRFCEFCNVQLRNTDEITSHYESTEHFVKRWRSN